jgi:hypothetical protein
MPHNGLYKKGGTRRDFLLGGLCLPLLGGACPVWAQQSGAPHWMPLSRAILDYEMDGYWNRPVSGEGRIDWKYDRASSLYELDLTISAMMMTFLYASRGTVDPAQGLIPVSYREKRIGRDCTVMIDHAAREVRFSWKPREVKAMPDGIQDVTSVVMQMTFLMANDLQKAQVGHRFKFPVARMGEVKFWDFEVMGHPVVETRLGRYTTWQVRRIPPDNVVDNDVKVEFWLAPELFYLPLKMLFNKKDEVQLWVSLQKIRQVAA